MIDARQSAMPLPAAMPLRPYQVGWIRDPARFKLAVKSARIGYSFGTALEAVLDCLEKPKATWTVLSASKAQSVEFGETCQKHTQLLGATANLYENEVFADTLGLSDFTQSRITFPNGSRIIALPANPRTARGYPGNAILDEFAHHEDSYAIWAAVIRQTALGNVLRVLSTPNGEQGKFFDLANDMALVDGPGPVNPMRKGPWSGHWIDVYTAVRQGCPINIEEMRAGIGDEDTWQQEFCCAFLKATGAWIPLDLIVGCEDAGATLDLPSPFRVRGRLVAGIDVARHHDATCFWMDELLGDVAWTRHVWWIHAKSFPEQHRLLRPLVAMCDRVALDSTGMGIALYDMFEESDPGKVMGVNFAGSTKPETRRPRSGSTSGDDAVASVRLKTYLAMLLKKQLEKAKCRLPYSQQIRSEFTSIKREATGSGVTFEAPRIEVDSAVAGGAKRKRYAHADAFWAKALAAFAAETSPIELGMTTTGRETGYQETRGYM